MELRQLGKVPKGYGVRTTFSVPLLRSNARVSVLTLILMFNGSDSPFWARRTVLQGKNNETGFRIPCCHLLTQGLIGYCPQRSVRTLFTETSLCGRVSFLLPHVLRKAACALYLPERLQWNNRTDIHTYLHTYLSYSGRYVQL